MKPSEELMLLLELNGFDVLKFKLKKQLEYEKTGNIDLYKHKKYADLVMSHYQFKENTDYYHRNPLTYKEIWGDDIKSIDQFYFKHSELDYEMTLREFIQMDKFNEVQKESILYDILDQWVEEYREASIKHMENLREMIQLLPKKSKRYKKPSKIAILFSIIFILLIAFLYKNPEALTGIPIVGQIFNGYNALLYDVNWFSFLGWLTVLFTALYAVLNNAFTRFIRDIRSEKNKHAEKTFDRWDNDMQESRLKQSGLLEDYVDRVIKKPKHTFFDIKELIGPEILIEKFKRYVLMVEKKYDFMTKYYRTFIKYLRLVFILSIILNIVFYGIGFAMVRGFINV